MKRKLFLWAAFAIVMALAGCTQREIVYVEKENGAGSEMQLEGNVLKISLSNGLTRAARPLWDGTATNNINRIGLKFLNPSSGEAVSGITIESASSGTSYAIPSGQVYTDNVIKLNPGYDPETITVKLNMDQATEQSVNIVVYGYNVVNDSEGFPYTISENYNNENTENNLTGDKILKCTGITASLELEEIFAGCSKDTYINEYGLFNESPEITLERQVAGLVAYLKNVPSQVMVGDESKAVTKISIRSPYNLNGLIIPAKGIGKTASPNRVIGDNEPYKYCNGIGTQQETDLLTFTLTGKINGTNASNNTYKFNEYDSQTGANTDLNIDGQVVFADYMEVSKFKDGKFVDNTLFGSCFILPFASNYSPSESYPTALSICYFYGEGENEYKKVDLKMQNGDTSSRKYSIWCNHFYSLGTKKNNEDTTDDEPLDISEESGTDEMLLTITDEWDNEVSLEK